MGIASEHVWFDTSELICIELKKLVRTKLNSTKCETNAKKLRSLHDPEIVISHCNCSLWAVSFHAICVAHSITSDDLDCPQSDQVFFLGLHNHSSSSQADHSFVDVGARTVHSILAKPSSCPKCQWFWYKLTHQWQSLCLSFPCNQLHCRCSPIIFFCFWHMWKKPSLSW